MVVVQELPRNHVVEFVRTDDLLAGGRVLQLKKQ